MAERSILSVASMDQPAPTQQHTVLLIEDDADLRHIYQTVLTNNNFHVEVAEDGQVGIEKMKTVHPHVVILDLVMPKMSGFDVLNMIEADEELMHTPIIVLTNIFVDVTEMLKRGGVVKCFMKSDTTPDMVVKEVQEAIANRTKVSKPY